MPNILLGDLSEDAVVSLTITDVGTRHRNVSRYSCTSLAELEVALISFMQQNPGETLLGAAFSACGWENGDGLTMPNNEFTVQRGWLKEILGISRLHLVNDCVSKAMALSLLGPSELTRIGSAPTNSSYVKLLLGIDKGFGTSVIIQGEEDVIVLPCEGGHSDLPTETDEEYRVMQYLKTKYGHVSRERAVSLPGLVDIWTSLAQKVPVETNVPSAEDIVTTAMAGQDRALQATNLCLHWLASAAGDIALTTGATGGIYFVGKLVQLFKPLMHSERFISRFHNKGRLSRFLLDIPLYVVEAEHAELVGLSTLFP